MLRRRALALVFGAFVAIAAATAASAQGRHLMGSTITSVQHSIGVSSSSHEGRGRQLARARTIRGEDNDDQGEDQDSSLGAGSDHPSIDPPSPPTESGDQGDQNDHQSLWSRRARPVPRG